MMQILEDIKGGISFEKAVSNHPRLFPSSIIAMIEAGESSGTLDIVLEEISNLLEDPADFKRKIITALAYPIFILIVGIGVVIFLLSFVVPKITVIFGELNQVLPLPTRILICISFFIRDSWVVILICLIFFVFLFRSMYLKDAFRAKIDSYLFSIWMIGVGVIYRHMLFPNICLLRFRKHFVMHHFLFKFQQIPVIFGIVFSLLVFITRKLLNGFDILPKRYQREVPFPVSQRPKKNQPNEPFCTAVIRYGSFL